MNFEQSIDRLRNASFAEWQRGKQQTPDVPRLFVIASGYEDRAMTWLKSTTEGGVSEAKIKILVFGFDSYTDHPVRVKNDIYVTALASEIIQVSSSDPGPVISRLLNEVHSLQADGGYVEVHIDYSSMPRCWYCELARSLPPVLASEAALYFWYTPGVYSTIDFPSAGVRDFRLFSGEPSLATSERIHIFGLGFDKIRSQAIHSVLDPSRYLCFYADPGARVTDAESVRTENDSLLSLAMEVFTVPLDDFVQIFSRVRAKAMLFRRRGDVILVPDGPKPLILAASLVPDSLSGDGICCFHVGRRSEPAQAVAIEAVGVPRGFMFGVIN